MRINKKYTDFTSPYSVLQFAICFGVIFPFGLAGTVRLYWLGKEELLGVIVLAVCSLFAVFLLIGSYLGIRDNRRGYFWLRLGSVLFLPLPPLWKAVWRLEQDILIYKKSGLLNGGDSEWSARRR